MIKKFNILGQDYKIKMFPVIVSNIEGKLILGQCDIDNKELQLSEQSCSEDELMHTCLHEVAHAFCYESGLGQNINGDTEEMVCVSIERLIMHNFKDQLRSLFKGYNKSKKNKIN